MSRLLWVLPVVFLAACESEEIEVAAADRVEIRLERRNAETVARYYVGGFMGPAGGDPVEAGLMSVDGSRLWIHPVALPAYASRALRDNGDGVLDGDEFAEWTASTYRTARALPSTLDSLAPGRPWAARDTAWFSIDVQGSPMTTALRRVHMPVAAVRAAVGAQVAGNGLTYPVGTVVVGEHLVDGEVVETTAKRRRADGFWDFMVYDAAGRLVGATTTPPRRLRVPQQCTGCHLGSRLFEPDRSFPGRAPRGPTGDRAIVVPEAWRDADVASIFREHATRADGLLGLYATVYVGRLRSEAGLGRALAPADRRLLEGLGVMSVR
jgi:hypothetical protein